jgi:hypothetical protein
LILRSPKTATKAFEVSGDGGTGADSGSTKLISQALAFQIIVQHQCAFAGRWRAFVGGAAHSYQRMAACKIGEYVANAKRVTTDAGTYTADYLVVALGAEYDCDATRVLPK